MSQLKSEMAAIIAEKDLTDAYNNACAVIETVETGEKEKALDYLSVLIDDISEARRRCRLISAG